MSLVNFNGKLLDSSVPILSIENRSFRYGDGLFESMRVVGGKVVMLERHLQRLSKGIEILKMTSAPDHTTDFWNDQIITLCRENDCKELGRIRLTIYRKSGGYYAQTDSNIGYLIEAEKNETGFSDEGAEGLDIGVYKELKKPMNALGNIKTANSLIYVLAGVAKEREGRDDMIILNDPGRVVEVISSNIFIVTKDVVKTPPLSEGCVAGVTRDWLISKITDQGISVEESPLKLEEIQGADEVFVTNAIQGIRKVSSLGESAFGHNILGDLLKFKPELE